VRGIFAIALGSIYCFLPPMGWALFGISILAMIIHGALLNFSGVLAAKLRMWLMAICGGALMLTALNLLFLVEPWATPDKAIPANGVHTGSGAALYAIIVFVLYAGPQLTGLLLGGVAAYILRGAHSAYWLQQRGVYDLPSQQ
jgi:hypothetical protein